ncbi:Uncharacterised protein [Chlamydia trachomatis]|nr:Uncharacterised protein [Chlamydia trachomatis]
MAITISAQMSCPTRGFVETSTTGSEAFATASAAVHTLAGCSSEVGMVVVSSATLNSVVASSGI